MRGLLLLVIGLTPAAASALSLPGPLVDVQWLSGHLDEVRVMDVRQVPGSFAADGHIPGAVPVQWARLQTTREVGGIALEGMAPQAAQFQALMREKGLNNDRPVIITAPGRQFIELTKMTRLYWTLRYYGHTRVALLSGGTAAWSDSGRSLSHAVPSVPRGDFLAKPTQTLRVTTDQVAELIQEDDAQLVDVRTLGYYLGLIKASYVDGYGHLPGAAPYPYTLALLGKPVRFRSKKTLAQLAGVFGIDLNRPIVVYCNTGVLSSAGWFIFHELLGNPQTRLYDGSMHAWTRLGQPTETMVLNTGSQTGRATPGH